MTYTTSVPTPFTPVNTPTSIHTTMTITDKDATALKTSLGTIISRRRNELGMSQVELSERVSKSQEWASNVETGKIKSPRLNTLRTLASALQTDPVELVVAAGYTTVPISARQLFDESHGFF